MIRARVTPSERRAVVSAARLVGLEVSEWARTAMLAAVKRGD